MNDKPILFSTEMVKAILEGRKTQTRRIIKSRYANGDIVFVKYPKDDNWYPFKSEDGESTV